jgi:hypothetical protein
MTGQLGNADYTRPRKFRERVDRWLRLVHAHKVFDQRRVGLGVMADNVDRQPSFPPDPSSFPEVPMLRHAVTAPICGSTRPPNFAPESS